MSGRARYNAQPPRAGCRPTPPYRRDPAPRWRGRHARVLRPRGQRRRSSRACGPPRLRRPMPGLPSPRRRWQRRTPIRAKRRPADETRTMHRSPAGEMWGCMQPASPPRRSRGSTFRRRELGLLRLELRGGGIYGLHFLVDVELQLCAEGWREFFRILNRRCLVDRVRYLLARLCDRDAIFVGNYLEGAPAPRQLQQRQLELVARVL